MKDLVRILSGSSVHLHRMADLLLENNIPSFIKDNVESARVAGFGIPENSIDLYVNESDVVRAKKIIEEFGE